MTTVRIAPMSDMEAERVAAARDDAGLGALRTPRGNLPLDRLAVSAQITGLTSQVELTQEYVNVHDEPLEATYVFPLPDRAAVTGMRMTAQGRVVEAVLRERGAARAEYDQAIAAGKRASIAEEERPDVFTMRVGNIVPGERVEVTLTLAGPLPVEDGAATFRFPLVVAPRYIPGAPLPGEAVGAGYAEDTDAVPDASRITPPVLLPGFPNPVKLAIDVAIDPAGLPLGEVRSSLHAISTADGRVQVRPGERANRDFVLRLAYGSAEHESAGLTLVPDADGAKRAEGGEGAGGAKRAEVDDGTYELTVLPPAGSAPPRPRDVVLLLDRSGSMEGWKMVAARRTAARIIDTLTDSDRFAVLAFDHVVEEPDTLPAGLVPGTDRNRFRAVEHLARMAARGGTELLDPMLRALRLLTAESAGPVAQAEPGRDRVLVLVTDGQVGNEDQILRSCVDQLRQVRIHTVGVDQAVNAGFLGRLASAGGGRCELVESEDRLDEAMQRIHQRIGSPLVRGLRLTPAGLTLVDDTRTPDRLPDLFPGVPYLVRGRYRGAAEGTLTLTGTTADGRAWSMTASATPARAPALPAIWARGHLRDLEDRYLTLTARTGGSAGDELEQRIVETSLRFGVLCRFTAFVAVDSRVVVEGGRRHKVVQPVEAPAGWGMFAQEEAPSRYGVATSGLAAPVPMGFAAGSARTFAAPMAAPLPSVMPGPVSPASAGRAGGPLRKLARQVSGRDRAVAGRAGGGGAVPEPALSTSLAEIRAQVAEEARRLRAAEGEPEYRRRELLEDLGTRLAALASDGAPETAPLRELAGALRPERLSERSLDELWRETLRVLDAVAAGGPDPGQAPEGRQAFWKL